MTCARLIDANLNRLQEGLRVVEDILRFVRDIPAVRQRVRDLRMEVAGRSAALARRVLTARSSRRDPGRAFRYDRLARRSLADVLLANLKRSQQAARVLEESCRLAGDPLARFFKRVRFTLYDLEADLAPRLTLFDPLLYVVLDAAWTRGRRLTALARVLRRGGATLVQLRAAKSADARTVVRQARELRAGLGTVPLIINDRADIAALLGAGVHLGQHDLPVAFARRLLGPDAIIGVSAATPSQARAAQAGGASYVAVGAIFRSATKPDCPVPGLAALRAVHRSVTIPVVAIGGLNVPRAVRALRAGADGIACAQAVLEGRVGQNLARMRRALVRARRQ